MYRDGTGASVGTRYGFRRTSGNSKTIPQHSRADTANEMLTKSLGLTAGSGFDFGNLGSPRQRNFSGNNTLDFSQLRSCFVAAFLGAEGCPKKTLQTSDEIQQTEQDKTSKNTSKYEQQHSTGNEAC